MTVKHVTGDLFSLNVDAIGHGVNCRGVMGSGIAVQFRERYPAMYLSYKQLCEQSNLNLGQVFVWEHGGKIIYNIASQYEPGPNANLEALKIAIQWVDFDATRRNLATVALPQIGCGIGGLGWSVVSMILEIYLEPSPVEFQLVTYGKAGEENA